MSSRLCLFSSFRSHDFAISILDFCVMTFHALYLTFLIVSSLLRLSVAIFIVVTCFCRHLTSSNTYSRIRCVNQQLVFAIISVLLRICFASFRKTASKRHVTAALESAGVHETLEKLAKRKHSHRRTGSWNE